MRSDRRRIWLVTGDPGSGKSTLVSRVVLQVKTAGYTVGGFLTREIRSHGERHGFRIVDLSSEDSAVISSVKGITGPKVGKYRVDLKSLSGFAAPALERAQEKSDLIVCDEIGPMELFSREIRNAVTSMLDSGKPLLCVIHKRLADPLVEDLRSRTDAKLYEVTFETREALVAEIAKEILAFLSGKSNEDQ